MRRTFTAALLKVVFTGGFLGAAMLGAVTASGQGGKTHARVPAVPVSAEEKAAYEVAKPAFERHCFRCHSRSSKKAKTKALKHIDMSAYPFGGHHPHDTGLAIRRSLLGDKAKGKEPTMPSNDPGSVQGDELAKLLAWADAFDKAHGGMAKSTDAKPGTGNQPHAH